MTASSTVRRDLVSPRWYGPLAMLGLGVALVTVAVIRLILFGWSSVAPDDARYVFVGLSTLAGHGPVTPNGNIFLLRSPVYGVALAGFGKPFGDPLMGARIIAAGLSLVALIGAVRLAWLIGGPVAGASTAICLIAMPLIWRLLPTLRIDLPQTAGVVGVLIAMQRPTMRRWAVAGGILGLTILVKETILLLGALPLAAVGLIPSRVLARLGLVYVIAAVAIAGWWWVVVWVNAGVIFPANAIGTIERREIGADVRIDWYGLILLVVATGAWLLLALRARTELPARLLVGAAACLVVPAAYATLNGLSARNYVGLAVLSAIAIGIAAASLVQAVGRQAGATRRVQLVTPVIASLLLAGAVLGQVRTGPPNGSPMPGQIADWLRPEIRRGDTVVMTFHYSDVLALELFGRAAVPELPISRYDASESLDGYLWLGLRDRQLFGFRRSIWTATLREPTTSHLVLAGPHAFTPIELVPALNRSMFAGVRRATELRAPDEWARIYNVTPTLVMSPSDVALHLSPATAIAWLDLAADAPTRTEREAQLIDARPVVIGRDVSAVLARLVHQACLVPADEGRDSFTLNPANTTNAAKAGAVCD